MLKSNIFHPFEMAFCGFSGSGKTTLIENVLNILRNYYNIGYVKHDVHHFEMDKQGKDTWKAFNAGAHEILISNDSQWARIGKGKSNRIDIKNSLVNLDFVLIEGHKNMDIPKLIVLGEGKSKYDILDRYQSGKLTNVIGFVGVEIEKDWDSSLPYFQRDRLDDIVAFILDFFNRQHAEIPLYGLVLAGGKSKRMGQDKGALDYHGMPQAAYLIEQLDFFSKKTYISCTREQIHAEHLHRHARITDAFIDCGPMGGILSAFQYAPNAAWLVLACDLPFVESSTLMQLVKERGYFKTATCFLNPDKGWAEPLCTIYEPKAYARFLQFFAQGYQCPRKMLMNSSIKTLHPENKKALINANTPEDYKEISGVNL